MFFLFLFLKSVMILYKCKILFLYFEVFVNNKDSISTKKGTTCSYRCSNSLSR
jgi:hypothetical protein